MGCGCSKKETSNKMPHWCTPNVHLCLYDITTVTHSWSLCIRPNNSNNESLLSPFIWVSQILYKELKRHMDIKDTIDVKTADQILFGLMTLITKAIPKHLAKSAENKRQMNQHFKEFANLLGKNDLLDTPEFYSLYGLCLIYTIKEASKPHILSPQVKKSWIRVYSWIMKKLIKYIEHPDIPDDSIIRRSHIVIKSKVASPFNQLLGFRGGRRLSGIKSSRSAGISRGSAIPLTDPTNTRRLGLSPGNPLSTKQVYKTRMMTLKNEWDQSQRQQTDRKYK